MKHYYLVASLPTLVLGEPAPFRGDEMPARCANLLDAAEMAELKLVLEGRETEGLSAFCRRWVDVDTQIRNAIVRVRAARRSVEPRDYLREHKGFDVFVEKGVADAYAKPNPYEKDFAIDRLRWQLLDEMVVAEPFSFAVVLAFAVKLRLVERWAAMTDEAGRARFEELVESMVAAVSESRAAVKK